MNSIFDDNSEFLKYMKEKQGITPTPNSETSPPSEFPLNAQGQTTPEATQALTTPTPSEDPYVLDLKAHTLKNTIVEEVPVVKITSHPKNTTISPHSTKELESINKKLNKVDNFVVDKVKFLFVSALIFGITFLAINWSAYSSVLGNKYRQLTNQTEDTPLFQFSENRTPEITKPSSEANEFETISSTDIPKLSLEVTPPGTRVIIPRLHSNVPVIGMSTNTLISRNWDALEKEMQEALKSGVVHYPGTPFPNQSGNVVLTGHSSYYPWDPGRFKDVFAILHEAHIGDEIIVFHDQKKYIYQITDIEKVLPTQVEVLGDMGDNRLTLITCTPIGTNLKRLIVTAKPIKA